jgi:hypothetical protein
MNRIKIQRRWKEKLIKMNKGIKINKAMTKLLLRKDIEGRRAYPSKIKITLSQHSMV